MKRSLFASVVAVSVAFGFGAFAADKKIEKLYNSKCSSCHGKDGKGATEKGQKMGIRDMTSEDFQKGTDADFKKAIQEGVKKEHDGKKQEMDPYKDEIKDPEIDGLIKMIREMKK